MEGRNKMIEVMTLDEKTYPKAIIYLEKNSNEIDYNEGVTIYKIKGGVEVRVNLKRELSVVKNPNKKDIVRDLEKIFET